MTSHPGPPPDLPVRRLPITVFRGVCLWRIYAAARAPLFFGRTGGNRFDAPADAAGHRAYGVLYVGRDAHCAFVETFGHSTGVRLIEPERLEQRALATVRADRPLRLVDLRGAGLARLGADAELTAGGSYAVSQAWSQALHDHPKMPDGLIYRARHDPSRFSVALFERVGVHLRAAPLGSSLKDTIHVALLGDLLDTYGFGLTP